jgi:hypothetical protein
MAHKTKDEKAKELEIRSLIELLQSQGLVIRREKLRSGSGFRVMSGVCRVEDSHLLFVDRRLSLDEQLDVLQEARDVLNGVGPAARPIVSEAA